MNLVAGSFASTCHVYLLISWLIAIVACDQRQLVATSAPGAEYMSEQPWAHPCGSLTPEQEDDMTMILDKVLLELRLVYYNKSILQFGAYSKVREAHDESSHSVHDRDSDPAMKTLRISHSSRSLNWLPNKNHLRCFHREICNLDPNERKRGVHILRHLYNMFQRFGITFYALKDFQYDGIDPLVQGEGGKVTFKEKRYKFFLKLHTYNQQIMCEVQRGIQKLKLELPASETIEIVMNNPNFKSRSNQMTDMILQDKGVLAMYKTFLNQSLRIIGAIRHPSRCFSLTARNHTRSQQQIPHQVQNKKEEDRAYSFESVRHMPKKLRQRNYMQHIHPQHTSTKRRPSANKGSMKVLRKRTKNPWVGLAKNYTGEPRKRRRGRVLNPRLKMIGKKCKWNLPTLRKSTFLDLVARSAD